MHIATLLAAAEKPVPLIDIDATVFIQFGIFVVMAAVLWTLVFKPYLKVRDERKLRIDGARDDASNMSRRAEDMLKDYDAQLLRARQRGADERGRLRTEGLAYERDVLGRTREVGQKAVVAARTNMALQRDAAALKLLADANELGQKIVGRILGTTPPTGMPR